MTANGPQETSPSTSASSMVKFAIAAVLVLAFIGFVLFYPAGDDSGPSTTTLTEGKPAPDFALTDMDGKDWKLSRLRGSVVVVNFWATWCPPCRQEMPSIDRLHKLTATTTNFVLLTVLYRDNPDAAKAYFESNDFTMPILLDPDSTAAKAYGLTGVPETFIIDKQGILRKKVIGPFEFDAPSSIDFFETLASE